jgi:hypothetical protein
MYSFGAGLERVTEHVGADPGGWVVTGGSTADPKKGEP